MANAPNLQYAGYGMAIGSLISLFGNLEAGRAARINAERARVAKQFEAEQAEKNAGLVLSVSQRAAAEETRKGRFEASRALAVAAASGGGVSDPTVVRLLSNVKGEATYRANVALYEGETKARQLRTSAITGRIEGFEMEAAGASIEQQYALAGAGEGLKGAASLYARYGLNGPNARGDAATVNPNPAWAG